MDWTGMTGLGHQILSPMPESTFLVPCNHPRASSYCILDGRKSNNLLKVVCSITLAPLLSVIIISPTPNCATAINSNKEEDPCRDTPPRSRRGEGRELFDGVLVLEDSLSIKVLSPDP